MKSLFGNCGIKRICLAALMAFALGSLATIESASAQWFWGASGREVVSFSKKYSPGQIIVSFADRRIYHIVKRGTAISYPIAIPKGEARWSGVERISRKQINPSWTPTPLMRRKNPKLPAYVPGGHPLNPLGSRALYLGNTLYRIHGTDAPWLIGKAVSSGCIRMYDAHVQELYKKVHIGTKVTINWRHYTTSSSSFAFSSLGGGTSVAALSGGGSASSLGGDLAGQR